MRERLLDRLPVFAGLTLLALAIGLGSFAMADGIRNRNQNDVISVTGSARRPIVSDYIVWTASISSQHARPAAAAAQLSAWAGQFGTFLRAEGAQESEIAVQPVTTETLTDDNGEVTGYRLTRYFEVRSARVEAIATLVESTSRLLARGIPVSANPPQYVYTKLPSLRPDLIAEATKDALARARVLVEATGAELGRLRAVNVGVFQVTAPNSTEVSDYGVYDTSTLNKDVTAVVNVSFAVK